jgi:hypothetical protein
MEVMSVRISTHFFKRRSALSARELVFGNASLKISHIPKYTGQFKKKVTLLHVYNEVLYPDRLLLWSRHFATRFPLAAAA